MTAVDKRFLQTMSVDRPGSLLGGALAERDLSERFTPQDKRALAERLHALRYAYPECRLGSSTTFDLQTEAQFQQYGDGEFTMLVSRQKLAELMKHNGPMHIVGRAQTGNEILAIADFLHTFTLSGRYHPTTMVMSYFPLQRGDRYQEQSVHGEQFVEMVPMVSLVEVLANHGVKRIICLDSHSPAFSYFAMREGIHVIDLSAIPLMLSSAARRGVLRLEDEHITVAGDDGASEMACMGMDVLNSMGYSCPGFAQGEKVKTLEKKEIRFSNEDLAKMPGKVAVIIEDIISTGGTMDKTIQQLLAAGVARIVIVATFPIFAGKAVEILTKYPQVKIVTTDGRLPMTDISGCPSIIQAPVVEKLGQVAQLDQLGIDFWSAEGEEELARLGLCRAPWLVYNS